MTCLTIAVFAAPLAANADEASEPTLPDVSSIELPSRADIPKMMDDMPDLNKLMDGVLAVSQDKELIDSLESTGDKLAEKIDKLGKMEMRDNGLPDLNFMMEELMMTLSDEDVVGEMLGVVEELTEAIDENLGDDNLE